MVHSLICAPHSPWWACQPAASKRKAMMFTVTAMRRLLETLRARKGDSCVCSARREIIDTS